MVPITELENGDLKIAPTHQAPTGWRAWIGENMSLGMMIAAAGMAAFTLYTGGTSLAAHFGLDGIASFLTTFGIFGAGGVIGGYFDKENSERQAEEGVIIDKPGFFNRGILSEGIFKGGLHGLVLAVAGMSIMGALEGWFPILSNFSVAGLAGLSSGLGIMLPVAIAGVAAAVGAVTGSISRKEKMEETYKQVATAYLMQTGRLAGKSRGMGIAPAALGAGAAGVGLAAAAKAKAVSVPALAGKTAAAATGIAMDMPQNPYDFSYLEDHPANNAGRRSFVAAESERRVPPFLGAESGV